MAKISMIKLAIEVNSVPERVETLLKESKYANCITSGFMGDSVEGDIDEITNYLMEILKNEREKEEKEREKLARQRSEALQAQSIREQESSASNMMLLKEINDLKDTLPDGAQYYEYKTMVIKDSDFIGAIDVERMDLILCKLALEGWRLKAAVTNESGHNRAVVVNATINSTILIFERLVTKE